MANPKGHEQMTLYISEYRKKYDEVKRLAKDMNTCIKMTQKMVANMNEWMDQSSRLCCSVLQ